MLVNFEKTTYSYSENKTEYANRGIVYEDNIAMVLYDLLDSNVDTIIDSVKDRINVEFSKIDNNLCLQNETSEDFFERWFENCSYSTNRKNQWEIFYSRGLSFDRNLPVVDLDFVNESKLRMKIKDNIGIERVSWSINNRQISQSNYTLEDKGIRYLDTSYLDFDLKKG